MIPNIDKMRLERELANCAMQQDQRGAIVAICDAFDDAEITALPKKDFQTGRGIKVPEAKEKIDRFDLVSHLYRQRDWSSKTFGPGARTEGVIAHIRKELSEIEQSPNDLEEWVDVVLLALDGAWRAGNEPEEIAAALREKQDKNKMRDWPDWKTSDPNGPIEHVKS